MIADARESIGKIEGHDLDDQQMTCIIKDAHNHNVVAGAGTGKTTTIIGKVKYLLAKGKFKSNEILVLSYTHAAASEMKQRLLSNTSTNINVVTFHRFGYYVLTEVEGKKPLIFSGSPRVILKEKLNGLLNDKTYVQKIVKFIGNGGGRDKSDLDGEFTGVEEYLRYTQ